MRRVSVDLEFWAKSSLSLEQTIASTIDSQVGIDQGRDYRTRTRASTTAGMGSLMFSNPAGCWCDAFECVTLVSRPGEQRAPQTMSDAQEFGRPEKEIAAQMGRVHH
jgi:hypothetical protein